VIWSDWLLFFHVLSAFALVGSMATFWALVLATRPASPLLSQSAAGGVVRPTNVLVIIGTVGTIVFGVWLAIDLDRYHVWDGWILAAIILWAIAGFLGDQSGKAFTKAMDGSLEDRRRGLRFHSAGSLVILAILVLMIWKPGA
jgi:uncharacterized membrane protein